MILVFGWRAMIARAGSGVAAGTICASLLLLLCFRIDTVDTMRGCLFGCRVRSACPASVRRSRPLLGSSDLVTVCNLDSWVHGVGSDYSMASDCVHGSNRTSTYLARYGACFVSARLEECSTKCGVSQKRVVCHVLIPRCIVMW